MLGTVGGEAGRLRGEEWNRVEGVGGALRVRLSLPPSCSSLRTVTSKMLRNICAYLIQTVVSVYKSVCLHSSLPFLLLFSSSSPVTLRLSGVTLFTNPLTVPIDILTFTLVSCDLLQVQILLLLNERHFLGNRDRKSERLQRTIF